MLKWSETKGPPPSWLDAADELTHDEADRYSVDRFIVECMEACLHLRCSPLQAGGVTANARNESANGQAYRFNNPFGWKITKAYAEEYRKSHDGKGPPYWSAPGNKAPGATPTDIKGGDPPWCFYRAFDSLDGALDEWIRHFTPRPGDPAPYGGYRKCGELFWSGGDWFPELIRVGYKGARTQKHPEGAIVEHQSLVRTSVIRWAQSRLRVTVDGIFGPKSRAMCIVFQTRYSLPTSGILDAETLSALAKNTTPNTPSIIV